ncbi:MAG: hemoglobin [Saprospiraceae bacterium]
MKKDIETRTDIEFLIWDFYKQLKTDETIGFIFTEVLQLDFDKHIPVICDFWESVLLHNPVYQGNVMHKHIDLDKKVKLLPEHFDRWMELFLGITNQHFEGEVTDELIKRVNLIKPLMQFKVESSRDSGFIQ